MTVYNNPLNNTLIRQFFHFNLGLKPQTRKHVRFPALKVHTHGPDKLMEISEAFVSRKLTVYKSTFYPPTPTPPSAPSWMKSKVGRIIFHQDK